MWVRFKISVEFVEHRAHVFRAYTAPVRKFEVVTFGSCDVFFFRAKGRIVRQDGYRTPRWPEEWQKLWLFSVLGMNHYTHLYIGIISIWAGFPAVRGIGKRKTCCDPKCGEIISWQDLKVSEELANVYAKQTSKCLCTIYDQRLWFVSVCFQIARHRHSSLFFFVSRIFVSINSTKTYRTDGFFWGGAHVGL